MADFTIKRGDFGTQPLRLTVSDANGPIDLTDANAVRLIMLSDGTHSTEEGDKQVRIKVGPLTVVDDPKEGKLEHLWENVDDPESGDPLDTLYDDTYRAECEIEFDDGSIQTVPNNGYFSVEVVADLGGVSP